MAPDPQTTPMLWCDFNSREDDDIWGGELYSTIADITHNGLPLEEGLEVFVFDYESNTEIVGMLAIIEQHNGLWYARIIGARDGYYYGPIPAGYFRMSGDISWYYKWFPETLSTE